MIRRAKRVWRRFGGDSLTRAVTAVASGTTPQQSSAIFNAAPTKAISPASIPPEMTMIVEPQPPPQSARRPRRVLLISSRRSSIVIESPSGACTRK